MSDQIQRALKSIASQGSDPGATRVWEQASQRATDRRADRRRVRRRSLASVIAAAATVSVVVAVVGLSRHRDARQILSVAPSTVKQPTPNTSEANAAQLVEGKWSTLPPAPIEARTGSGSSVVWTGHELIVWGGATGKNGDELRADGAAYNPKTNRWRLLPRSPLSARVGQSAIWTGSELIVWGGYDDLARTRVHVTNDGAAYNPQTNTWRQLPASPLAARHDPVAVWTGDRMILLGGEPAEEDQTHRGFSDGASYNPASDSWQTLAMPVPPAGHPLTWRAAVQAGPDQLLAWSQWAILRSTATAVPRGGADVFRLDEVTGRWRSVPQAVAALPTISEVIWDGAGVFVRGAVYNSPGSLGPPPPEATVLYDPSTGSWRRLPADPLGSESSPSGWTGAALWSFSPGANRSVPPGGIRPAEATVYDPASDAWSRTAPAPFGCTDSYAPIWTGRELLMYCIGAPTEAAGLVYTPAPAS